MSDYVTPKVFKQEYINGRATDSSITFIRECLSVWHTLMEVFDSITFGALREREIRLSANMVSMYKTERMCMVCVYIDMDVMFYVCIFTNTKLKDSKTLNIA